MKYLLLLSMLIGCGQMEKEPTQERTVLIESEPCTTEQTDTGATITCPDGTTTVILNGVTGPSGPACSVEQTVAGAVIICEDTSAEVQDGNSPVQQILFHGTVCNNLNVLGMIGGSKFIAYGNEVFILTTTEATIWTQTNGTRYCKVKLDEAGSVVINYAP